MPEKNKPIKVEFAPGCFDQFDGTQEELDALQKEIMDMLTNMTPEELAENSRSVDFGGLEDSDLSEDELFALQNAFRETPNRNLQ
jgi:hypothetical protein